MTYRVLITRPLQVAQPLLAALAKLNIQAKLLPLLQIKPLAAQKSWHEIRSNLDQYDTLIAISPNAANLGMDYLSHYWTQWPESLNAWAVGKTTASALKSWGLAAQYPESAQHAEGLVAALKPMRSQIKRCLILKGLGGRETLEHWLEASEITTHTLSLYERSHAEHSSTQINSMLYPKPDLVSITSGESLLAFLKLKNHLDTDIFQVKIMVPSERLVQSANALGFTAVYRAPGVDTQAQLHGIQEILNHIGTEHD